MSNTPTSAAEVTSTRWPLERILVALAGTMTLLSVVTSPARS